MASDSRVVCISRTLAAGGESVGEQVATRLGFRYVDEQIIDAAARQAQVDPGVVAAAEQPQKLVARILEKLPRVWDVAGAFAMAPSVADDGRVGHISLDDMRSVIRAAIHEEARFGRVVIVAHAASMALAGEEGVLRVLVTAPPAVRARRLAAAQGIDLAAAEAAIEKSDHERQDYLRRFYEVHEELPTHYDLLINTEVVSSERASAAIVAAARESNM